MSKSLSNRFDRIVLENLPKRLQMLEVLFENALSASSFSRQRIGVRSLLKETGRISDFKGIYVFLQNGKPVYIDESSYVIRRLLRHFKGSTKYQRKLAHTISDLRKKTNKEYLISDALKEMNEMNIVFMDLPDDLERKLTTLYFQSHYDCVFNMFD